MGYRTTACVLGLISYAALLVPFPHARGATLLFRLCLAGLFAAVSVIVAVTLRRVVETADTPMKALGSALLISTLALALVVLPLSVFWWFAGPHASPSLDLPRGLLQIAFIAFVFVVQFTLEGFYVILPLGLIAHYVLAWSARPRQT